MGDLGDTVARHAFGQTFAYHALIRLAPIRASGENRLGFAGSGAGHGWQSSHSAAAPRHAAVEAVSCGKNGSLLGQGVLARFESWSIDNEKGTITVVGPRSTGRRSDEGQSHRQSAA
jgi:hypothetical protein